MSTTAEKQIANRNQLERDAHHEAGHCVAAVLLGVPIDSVELRPGENPSGRFRFGTVKPDQRDAVVIVSKAGLLAELLFYPSAPREPRRQDELIAARAIRGNVACIFPAARAEFLADAQAQALRLVTENPLTVAAFADELLSKGKLSGQEVADFVRHHTQKGISKSEIKERTNTKSVSTLDPNIGATLKASLSKTNHRSTPPHEKLLLE